MYTRGLSRDCTAARGSYGRTASLNASAPARDHASACVLVCAPFKRIKIIVRCVCVCVSPREPGTRNESYATEPIISAFLASNEEINRKRLSSGRMVTMMAKWLGLDGMGVIVSVLGLAWIRDANTSSVYLIVMLKTINTTLSYSITVKLAKLPSW